MTTTLQLQLVWTDEFIKWDKNLYSNDLVFSFYEIWVPSLVSNNNLVNFKIDSTKGYELDLNFYTIFDLYERNKYLINVDSSGKCTWKYPIKLMTVCQFDQQIFPFDSQECFIDFRPSAFYSNQLKLSAKSVNFNQIKASEFDLINVETKEKFQISNSNSDIDEIKSISVIRVTFLIKRKLTFYTNKIILPYFVFYVVTLFTYLLPVDSGEKKSLSTSILISSFYFFKDCLFFISKTSFLSLLSLYFNLNLVFVFICIILTTLVYSIYYVKRHNKPISTLLAIFFSKTDLKKEKIKREAFWYEQRQKISENFNKLNLLIYKPQNNCNHIKEKIKRELVKVNTQIMSFNTSTITVPRIKAKKTVDLKHFLAFKHLSVLKKFKNLIIAHNNAQTLINHKTNRNQNKSNQKEIFESNEKSLKAINLMNTLENLKLEILNKKFKNKAKSLNKIDLDNIYGDNYNPIDNTHLSKSLNATDQNFGSTELLDYLERREERENNIRNAKLFLEIIKEYKIRIQFHLGKLDNKRKNYQRIYPLDSSLNYTNQWKRLALKMDKKLFFIFLILVTLCILYLYLKAMLAF